MLSLLPRRAVRLRLHREQRHRRDRCPPPSPHPPACHPHTPVRPATGSIASINCRNEAPGSGGQNTWPCAARMPSSRSFITCSKLSTPSATTSMRMLRARSTSDFDDLGRVVLGQDAVDEHLVDLDRVGAELEHVGQAAVAGADIVDRDTASEFLQAGDDPARAASRFSSGCRSVTSSTTCRMRIGDGPKISRTSLTMVSSAKCSAARLKPILMSGRKASASPTSSQARRISARVNGMISPLDSANGMNAHGTMIVPSACASESALRPRAAGRSGYRPPAGSKERIHWRRSPARNR